VHIDNTVPCNDGIDCTTPDRCSNGVCTGPLCPDICNDNAGCTTDTCDRVIGCVHTNTCANGQVCCTTNWGTCVDECEDCANTCNA
jgi:hypothetical protein